MPHSDPSTVEPMTRAVRLMLDQTPERPFTILDCGVGVGYIGRALRTAGLGTPLRIVGLEIFEPYVKPGPVRTKLEQQSGVFHHLYDVVQIENFITAIDRAEPRSEHAIIFGDSLEHVEPEQADLTLTKARRVAKCGVVVNAPVIHYPQASLYGNVHETHRLHWTRAEWERRGGIYLGGNGTVGCFLFGPKT